MGRPIAIFSGTDGQSLTESVCERLSVGPANRILQRFGDGEVRTQLLENVRGRDVFIINPTNPPAENMLEAVFLAKAAVGSSAWRVTLVIPYLGYNRQERKDRPRVSVSAKIFIEMLKLSGADRALLVDVHAEATVPHFEPMLTDHVYGSYVTIPYLKTMLGDNYVVASTDAGGVARARKYRHHLGAKKLVIFDKDRPEPGMIDEDTIQIIGSVRGKDVLFVDDMIDSGGTLIADAMAAKEQGAKRIFACATHALFSKGLGVFPKGLFDELIITDSVYHQPGKFKVDNVKITSLSIAPLLADAIRRLNDEASLTELILKK